MSSCCAVNPSHRHSVAASTSLKHKSMDLKIQSQDTWPIFALQGLVPHSLVSLFHGQPVSEHDCGGLSTTFQDLLVQMELASVCLWYAPGTVGEKAQVLRPFVIITRRTCAMSGPFHVGPLPIERCAIFMFRTCVMPDLHDFRYTKLSPVRPTVCHTCAI